VLVFTGDKESAKKDFSVAFPCVFCVWYTKLELFTKAMDMLENIQVQLEQTRSELEQARIERAQARSELAQARHESSLTRAELAQTRAELEQARAELARAHDKIAQLNATVEQILMERAEFKCQSEALEKKCAVLERDNLDFRRRLEVLENVEEKRALAQKGLNEFMEKCSKLGNEFAEYRRTHP
jgi:uncharacterized protein (DUF3084 family)